MANQAATETGNRRERRRNALWAGLALLIILPLVALWVMVATSDDENIVLHRNEAVKLASGERGWRGSFWNHTDSVYTNLDAVILFLDKDGKPVGQARGGSAKLEPGESFPLGAPLPRDAVRIQMYQLRWTTGDTRVVLGPWRPWPFGYVQY